MRSSLYHLTWRTVLNSISHSTAFSDNLDRLMPTAESQETMHLFIDFLAERVGGRGGERDGGRWVCQACVRMTTWMCPCSSCMYDREVEKGTKSRNVNQSPKRCSECTAERKSETTGISRGIVFLVTHPVFVPALLQRVGAGNKMLHFHRETRPTVGMLTNNNNNNKKKMTAIEFKQN